MFDLLLYFLGHRTGFEVFKFFKFHDGDNAMNGIGEKNFICICQSFHGYEFLLDLEPERRRMGNHKLAHDAIYNGLRFGCDEGVPFEEKDIGTGGFEKKLLVVVEQYIVKRPCEAFFPYIFGVGHEFELIGLDTLKRNLS